MRSREFDLEGGRPPSPAARRADARRRSQSPGGPRGSESHRRRSPRRRPSAGRPGGFRVRVQRERAQHATGDPGTRQRELSRLGGVPGARQDQALRSRHAGGDRLADQEVVETPGVRRRSSSSLSRHAAATSGAIGPPPTPDRSRDRAAGSFGSEIAACTSADGGCPQWASAPWTGARSPSARVQSITRRMSPWS